jgi:hypothetical protein
MLLDLDATVDVTIGGRVWKVSAVPAGLAAELTARPASVLAPVPDGLIVEGADGARAVAPGREAEWSAITAERFGQYLAIHAEWIRWGLRSLASPGVERRYAGRSFRVLDDARVEAICRVNGGALAHELGNAIRAANAVSEEEALGFLSPSGA